MTPSPKSVPFCRRYRWLIEIRADETQQLWPDLCVLKIPLIVDRPLGPIANRKITQSVSVFLHVYTEVRI